MARAFDVCALPDTGSQGSRSVALAREPLGLGRQSRGVDRGPESYTLVTRRFQAMQCERVCCVCRLMQ